MRRRRSKRKRRGGEGGIGRKRLNTASLNLETAGKKGRKGKKSNNKSDSGTKKGRENVDSAKDWDYFNYKLQKTAPLDIFLHFYALISMKMGIFWKLQVGNGKNRLGISWLLFRALFLHQVG